MVVLTAINTKMAEKSKTLVTGGTGFVGRAVVVALLAQGRPVRVLARNPKHPALAGLPVEVARGDLRDRVSLELALEGCSQLFHVAADYRLWVPDPEDDVCGQRGGHPQSPGRGPGPGSEPGGLYQHRGDPGQPRGRHPGHAKTPRCACQTWWAIISAPNSWPRRWPWSSPPQGLPLVVVNPSTPMGPWDSRPTPTGQIIVDFLQGRMPAYLETGLNLIHVEDVARGHLLAEARGQVGEKYILGNANLSLSQIFQMLAEISGRPAPRVKLPYWPVLALAYVDEFFTGRLRGKTTPHARHRHPHGQEIYVL